MPHSNERDLEANLLLCRVWFLVAGDMVGLYEGCSEGPCFLVVLGRPFQGLKDSRKFRERRR